MTESSQTGTTRNRALRTLSARSSLMTTAMVAGSRLAGPGSRSHGLSPSLQEHVRARHLLR